MLRVNIISKSSVGLTRDRELLADALRAARCEVSVSVMGSRQSGWRKSSLRKLLQAVGIVSVAKRSPRYDVNVMLEHVWIQYVKDAKLNVVVPNPDFFDKHDVAALRHVDRVWAKTVNTRGIFERLSCNVTSIGFDSEDRFVAESERKRVYFHLAGSSSLKGTVRLLKVWAEHPEWPPLTVVGRLKWTVPKAANVKLESGYFEDTQLRRMQNESEVHVCTSETEGWGHYLAEGLSVGAVVVTLAAPPMNELVTQERGVLLSCRPAGLRHLARCYEFDEAALVAAVARIESMSRQEIAEFGNKARAWFLANKRDFPTRIARALAGLEGDVETASESSRKAPA